MNKFKLFPLALAAFAFSACTSEDAVENNPNVEGVKSYVAVNINNVGAGTRATDGGYADGVGNENTINAVRFYFFTADGSAYKMTNGQSYVQKDDVTGTTKDNPNVEKITDAMLVIKGATATAPHSMIAVVNPGALDAGVLKPAMTKAEVEAVVSKQNFAGNGAAATNFVMSNSVYAEGNQPVWVSDITGHVATEADAAKNNPVDIYVERVAAKLTSTAGGATDGKFMVGTTTNGTEVYAVIKGWGIAQETNDANLIKKIDAMWDKADLGFEWNHPAYFRSYWEASRTDLKTAKTYNQYKSQIGQVYYTNPNTNAPEYVATVELQYADGTAAEICSYKGVEYLSEEAVKNAILLENKEYTKRTPGTDGTTIENLTINDIHFVVEGYQVKAQLNEGVTVYKGEVEATAEANTKIGGTLAEIRKDGMAYYHTGVEHLGTAKGIVRNHFYQIDVNTINGFGTPVYDPDSEFIPVDPQEVKTYIAATINVLSWRVVSQTVDLGK